MLKNYRINSNINYLFSKLEVDMLIVRDSIEKYIKDLDSDVVLFDKNDDIIFKTDIKVKEVNNLINDFKEEEMTGEFSFENEDVVVKSFHKENYKAVFIHYYKQVREDYKKEISKINSEFKIILDSIQDEIFIADKNGSVIFANKGCERLYNAKREKFIGKNVKDLENKLVFSPTVTGLVLKTKKTESMIQNTIADKKILATAMPILDENNEIKRVVTNSRDLTELTDLKNQLEDKNVLIDYWSSKYEELEIEHQKQTDGDLLFIGKEMLKIRDLIDKVSKSSINLLLTGESGVGKSVLAEYIHNKSSFKEGPFQVIDCSSIPESLLESELFGYEKGAFTGASEKGKTGLFELANEGTIFLDEIGELSPNLQSKLLRVIQEKKFRRIGGNKEIKVNFRLMTATNQNLEKKVENGEFRRDLYYRIKGVQINIPPLRERNDEIDILAYYYLREYNKKYGDNKKFSKKILRKFHKYRWHGNIRELKNVVERLVLVSESDFISEEDLSEDLIDKFVKEEEGFFLEKYESLNDAVEDIEKKMIKSAYKKNQNSYEVAKTLGISQPTAYRKIKKYIKK